MITYQSLNEKYLIFSSNVKFFRKQLGLTQEQFAELCDLSTSYIKQIEAQREYKNVTLSTLIVISNALNIEIQDLFIQHSIR